MCEATKEGVGFYRPRQPQETLFYKLVARFYPKFERVYEERYRERYGFWRPIIARAVARFLDSGDLKQGFARVRCPKWRHELFVAFFVPRPVRLPELPPGAGAGESRLGG